MGKKKPASKASSFSVHDLLGPSGGGDSAAATLGHASAVNVVCHCAGTSPLNLDKSLSALGVNGIPFQMCVYGSVSYLGYDIPDVSAIPDGPDDLLIAVVDAIQNAPQKK
jgi:hypothetical protein